MKRQYFSVNCKGAPTVSPISEHIDLLDIFRSKKCVNICAPMVEYSRVRFRNLSRQYGVDIAYSPMIIAEDFANNRIQRLGEWETSDDDRPLIVQFGTNDPVAYADAAEIVYPYCNGVDLNCGCPQKWAIRRCIGSCLLKKPELLQDMLRQLHNRLPSTNFSKTIKIRLQDDLTKTVELCRQAEAAGVTWIAVHGRTPDAIVLTGCPVNYDAIKLVKDSVSVPVVANGDAYNMADVDRIIEQTGADGVMAARGLLRNPTMFAGYEKCPFPVMKEWIAMFEGETDYLAWTECHHHLLKMVQPYLTKAELGEFSGLVKQNALIMEFMRNKLPEFDKVEG
ncbi:tRNA-dihydrouridine(20a/20b) synthase [NAD(P)+]-like [Paramacrobiotus metropolitanus]|uniref:tRNA-dihydrouridine(20a/20b) synthase [NAD(P)+]-like n=1 Tax=Paramacrobiotus metropolitanus TaxID=2943436 RepID=UPI0024457FE0|nr:tRNA-dihydrouridine(20a/20b) synthase [NAD(P)+]-like [Paramacrobiotus metropolitanus]